MSKHNIYGVQAKPPVSIQRDEVHLWFAKIPDVMDETLNTLCRSVLSKQEQAKLNDMRSPSRKSQFLVSRRVLKSVLAAYHSNLSAKDVTFTFNRYGKPSLNQQDSTIEFNLSHSKNLILLAITQGRAIGVDIEFINKKRNFEQIALEYFHDKEWPQQQQTPLKRDEQVKRFYALWTLKEAWVKGRGQSIVSSSQQGYFENIESRKPRLVPQAPSAGACEWQFKQDFLMAEYSYAVALQTSCDNEDLTLLTKPYTEITAFSFINSL